MNDIRQIHKIEEHALDILSSIRGRPCRVGLIGDNLLPVNIFNVIRTALPKAEFAPVTRMLIELRQVKSDAEIALMEKAAAINDQVLQEILKKCRDSPRAQTSSLSSGTIRNERARLERAGTDRR